MTKRICVVTSTRAEYGAMFWLLKELDDDPEVDLQLIVSGTHLSAQFGNTYRIIEADGFRISKKIEIILSSDTSVGTCKAMGLTQIGFADALSELNPDLMLVFGDRFEIFAAASAAMTLGIPLAHFSGGEITEGALDDTFRHCLTKLSHIHFTATEAFRKRVIQLGENPHNVHNVGELGLDNFFKLKLYSRSETEEKLGFKFGQRNALFTFHPVTLEKDLAENQISEILSALEQRDDLRIIFTGTNADPGGRLIEDRILEFVKKHPQRSVFSTNLGQQLYLATMKQVDFLIGNSSSGVCEAATIGVPAINIGSRQKGRLQPKSVVNCPPEKRAVTDSIAMVFSEDFQALLKDVINPYGSGGSSSKSKNILKTYLEKPRQALLKKSFFDLDSR